MATSMGMATPPNDDGNGNRNCSGNGDRTETDLNLLEEPCSASTPPQGRSRIPLREICAQYWSVRKLVKGRLNCGAGVE